MSKTVICNLDRQADVWLANTVGISLQALVDEYCAILDSQERDKLMRFRFDRNRLHYLAAHALLRIVLSYYGPCLPHQWRFVRDQYGKPHIVPGAGFPALQFNLTHCDGLVACVITLDRACGIDAEVIRPLVDLSGIARAVFSEAEIAWLNAHTRDRLEDAFFSLWTLKEAFIKATGYGFSMPVQKITIAIDALHAALVDSVDTRFNPRLWQLHLIRELPSHHVAVAIKNPSTPINIGIRRVDLGAGLNALSKDVDLNFRRLQL